MISEEGERFLQETEAEWRETQRRLSQRGWRPLTRRRLGLIVCVTAVELLVGLPVLFTLDALSHHGVNQYLWTPILGAEFWGLFLLAAGNSRVRAWSDELHGRS